MKKMMKLREIERLRHLIKKGQQVVDVFNRIEFAQRGRITRELLRDVEVARELSDDMKEYQKKEADVYLKMGTRVTMPDGKIGYKIEDWAPVIETLGKLQKEYKEIIEADKRAKEDIEKLLDREVELEMDPMKNGWFENFINGDDVEFLLEHGLLDLEDDGDNGKNAVSSSRKKRVSKGRKSKRR